MNSSECGVVSPARASFLRFASGLVIAALCTPASAAFTNLNGTVFTSTAGTLAQQSFVDVPVCAFSGLQGMDTIGNDGVAHGSLNAPGGTFTLAAHACSGGPLPEYGGQANASAHCDAIQDFTIASATLPPGTPVMVSMRWAVAGRVTAIGQPLTHHTAGAYAALDGRVGIDIFTPSMTIVSKTGSVSRHHNLFDGFFYGVGGNLNLEGESGEYLVPVLVGQAFRFNLIGTATGVSTATLSSVTQGDAQLAMVWGITALDPNASAVSITYPGQPAPPAEMATPAHAMAILPDRPPGSPVCFGIQSQPLDAVTCPAGTAAFSVAALGTGPFTYQWQLETAPGVWQSLGNDPFPLACGPGAFAFATPINSPTVSIGVRQCPGPFQVRCLITNPCGSIASNEATLGISSCPGDANSDFAVGLADVAAIINCWTMSSSCNVCADLDGNGTIGLGDVAMVISHWASMCP